MANRIFIPETSKQYTLAEDATILLYPWNEHPNKKIVYQDFYAMPAKGELKYKSKRELITLNGNENYWGAHHVNNMVITDWYIVSNHTFPTSILSLVKTPMDLQKLDSQGTVYLQTESVSNWVNRHYKAFVNKSDEVNTFGSHNVVKVERIVSQIKSFEKDIVEESNNKAIAAIHRLNPVLDKIKKNYIPIEHVFSKGASFEIVDVKSKLYDSKIVVATVKVDGNLISILPEQLNEFVLD